MCSSPELAAAAAAAAAAWLAFETVLYADPPAPPPSSPPPPPPPSPPPLRPRPRPSPRYLSPPHGPLETITEENRGGDWDPEELGFWTPAGSKEEIRRLIRLAEISEYFNPTGFMHT